MTASQWKRLLAPLVSDADDAFDKLKSRLSTRLGLGDTLHIEPYLGFGTVTDLHLKGRLLEKEGRPPADNDTVWRNILNIYSYLESDEVAGATLLARLAEHEQTAVTDGEGFFDLHWQLPAPLPGDRFWHEVTIELVEAPVPFEGTLRATGRVMVPAPNVAFGIISDIDDTVLQSSAASYLKAARLLLLNNARTRLPFEGVAAFYHALQQGGPQASPNPIFYVSSSPWNLYRLLIDFFTFNDIPLGPLLLNDYGFSAEQLFTSGHQAHKLAQIRRILSTYPHLPFVLIGDSGQEDPEIYMKVVADYPGRVKAIYIRDVSLPERDATVLALFDEMGSAGVPLVLAENSLAAARHAAEHGLGVGLRRSIDPEALPAIMAGKRKDELAPTTIEAALEQL